MKILAGLLAVAMLVSTVAPALALDEQDKKELAVILPVGLIPGILAATITTTAAGAVMELSFIGGVGLAMGVGNYLEWKSEKRLSALGLHRYNRQAGVLSEDRKWEREPGSNFKRLKGYTTKIARLIDPVPTQNFTHR